MVRILETKASHTYGMLDPLVIERRDTKFVNASLSNALNVIVLPQGGYTDRGGSLRYSIVRRKLAAIALTSGMVTAPNGGTAANLIDASTATLFTTSAVAGDPFTVFTLDLGAATLVSAVDLNNFSCALLGRDACVNMQYYDGTNWNDFSVLQAIRTAARNRRFARSPSQGNVSTQQLRMLVTGGSGLGEISIGSIRVLTETANRSDAVTRSFNYKLGFRYQMVWTENNIDMFKDGVWQCALPAMWPEASLRAIKGSVDYDTMLLFQQQLPSPRLLRQGSDSEWQLDLLPYENMPLEDYGGTYANGVNEVQRIRFYGMSATSPFQLILAGNKTNEIQVAAVWADTAPLIKAALELLPGVDPGLIVTCVSDANFTIEFAGGNNAAKDWPQMEGVAFANDQYISVGTVTKGKAAGENLYSDARGWPAVGRFAQERLVTAGNSDKPGSFIASVTGAPYNMDIELGGAAAALSFDLAGEQNTVREIFVSSTMIMWTDSAPYHLASPVLSAEETPEAFKADAPGIDANLGAVSLGNSIFYFPRGGNSLYQLNYSTLEKNFIGKNASVLSAILVDKPIDRTLRRSTRGNDADLLLYINQDNRLVTLTIMEAQEVSGFTPHQTEGKYISLCTDSDENVWQLVERGLPGSERIWLEVMQPDELLDGAIIASKAPGSNVTFTGLSVFNGMSIWAVADGKVQGPVTVSGGTATLQKAVTAATARFGHWTPPTATDTPFYPEEEQQRPMARKKRVNGVELSVMNTSALALGVNGAEPLPLLINEPVTGRIVTEGWPGFTDDATMTVTQTRPGKLTVRAVKKRIAA